MSLWSNNLHGPTFRYLWALPSTEAAAARRRLSLAERLIGIDWHRLEPHRLVEGVSKVRDAMLVQGSSPAAINNTLSVLRGIARTAHEMGQVTDEELVVAEAVSDVPDPKSERRLLAGWELSAVISACVRETTAKGSRDAALISIMYAGGLDPRQTTALEMGDWRVDDTLLRLGSHGRPLPLGKDAAALLRHWVALRDFALRGSGPDFLFMVVDKADHVQSRSMTPPMVGGILRKRAEEARVRRFSHADLRRTAAADMLTAGAKYSEVHRILGHPVPELKPELLEEYGALGGPRIRAIRLGSRHLDYFDVMGGFHFQDYAFDNDAENDEPEWPDSFAGHLTDHVETPWGTVACGAIGEGPPVVFVHGTPWSSFCWRRVAPSLMGRHSVYAYDLLGHGDFWCSRLARGERPSF